MLDKNMKLGRFRNMTERKQKAFWLIAEALYDMRAGVTVPLYNKEELQEISKALCYDFPEFGVSWNCEKVRYRENLQNGKVESITCFLNYNSSRQILEQKMRKINLEVEKILQVCGKGGNMNVEQWIETVYLHLTKMMKYSELQEDGTFPRYSYTLECLLHRDGVCAGIASVYAYVLKKLHIPVMVISGIADGGNNRGKHAWNIVGLPNGECKHVDVTWGIDRLYPQYFALDDIAMKARRHQWVVKEYPVCS